MHNANLQERDAERASRGEDHTDCIPHRSEPPAPSGWPEPARSLEPHRVSTVRPAFASNDRRPIPATLAPDHYQAAWERVARSLARRWSLEELARECGCCREVLRRRCVREFGRSPMQHVTFLRLNAAATLLRDSQDKVEYIAAMVGYADACAFSSMFKRWTGLSPSAFRFNLQSRQQQPP